MTQTKEPPATAAGSTERLVEVARGIAFDAIPLDAREVGKAAMLDGIGNMLAGSAEPLGRVLADFVRGMGAAPVATVIGTGLKTAAPYAAFANAGFAHSMDFEVMWVPPVHPTSPVLPALLALAEQERGPAGADVLRALVVAFEVQGRMSLASLGTHKRGYRFHSASTIGTIGSAIACSLLLGLDAAMTRHALGIAAGRAGGLVANTGTMTKSQNPANAARSGVESALLARAGYTAHESILEAEDGFVEAVYGDGFDFEALTRDFGRPYRMVDPGLAFKFYPAQFTTHWGIDATLEATRKHVIHPSDVRSVHVRVGKPNWSAPRVRPASGLEGKFSIPYTVALALLDGRITVDSFTDERRFAPDMEGMLARVTVVEDEAIPPGLDFANTWAEVTVELADGRRVTERCVAPRGRWDRPLTRDERLAKFHDCAQRRLPRSQADWVVGRVEHVEELAPADLAELMTVIGGRPGDG